MILGDLQTWKDEKNGYSLRIQKAIEYIECSELIHLESGRYEIDEKMFVVVQEMDAVEKATRMAECHAQYIDVHYLISGEEEVIGVARHSEENVVVDNLLNSNDCIFFEDIQGEFEITLKPGMFAVFFSSDLHRPGCSRKGNTRIKKIVIKICKDSL